jgi:two-component system LytT family sensor kinase
MKEFNWYMIGRIEKIILILLFFTVTFAVIYHPTEPVFIREFNNKDGSIYAARFVDAIVSVCIFFTVAFFLVPRYLIRWKAWPFILGSIFILAGISAGEYGLDRVILKLFNLPSGPNEISDTMMQYARRNIYHSPIVPGNLMVYMLGCLYGLSRDWIFKSRKQSQLLREKMQADIDLLRSQINPHFFFNALNNIYAITQRNKDPEAGDALLRLSDVMRYMIYDSNVEFIGLDKEIGHLQKYVDVMRLRYAKDDSLDIRISKKGALKRHRIAPLILLPFVENAFKHGLTAKGEGYVSIDMGVVNNRLRFIIKNSRQPGRKDFRKHPGIGLDNVKKRLSLIYPDRHNLLITKTRECYHVDLTINFKE